MSKSLKQAIIPLLFSLLVFSLLAMLFAMPAHAGKAKPPSTGKAVALKLCQACHAFPGADQAGSVGPPFVSMKQRFPKRERLMAIIGDAPKALKPHTMMPPFGRHGFLNKQQTEKLIDFLYTL